MDCMKEIPNTRRVNSWMRGPMFIPVSLCHCHLYFCLATPWIVRCCLKPASCICIYSPLPLTTPPSSVIWEGYHLELTSVLYHLPPPLQVCQGARPQCDQTLNKTLELIYRDWSIEMTAAGMIGGSGVWTCT